MRPYLWFQAGNTWRQPGGRVTPYPVTNRVVDMSRSIADSSALPSIGPCSVSVLPFSRSIKRSVRCGGDAFACRSRRLCLNVVKKTAGFKAGLDRRGHCGESDF